MNVLSLFDGMSCGQIALEKAGIKVDNYYASEIKAHAIKVTKENFPNTIHIGDVTKIWYEKGVLHTENGDFKTKIDILIGGSPCQDISYLKTKTDEPMQGVYGEKSNLFFDYLKISQTVKPKYFLLENVNGKKASLAAITNWVGFEPININSNLVSYQNRNRVYWTNIPNITIPKDRNINFQDFKETDINIQRGYKVNYTPSRVKMWEKQCPNVTHRKKINCLTCKQDRRSNAGLIEFEDFCRFLTVKECEMAQTVPIGYTSCLTRSQSYDVLGDGWTVDVIAHILSFIK